jgi:hypothetical protein
MKDCRVKKIITFVIITLFIGLTVTTSLASKISKNTSITDLIEIKTDTYGLSGLKSQTVKLTKQQITEIEKLFDTIKTRMDNAQSKEEIATLVSEGIAELNKYGLLPKGSSIEQFQRLIHLMISQYEVKNLLKHDLRNQIINADTNTNCLFIAEMNESRYLRNHASSGLGLFLFFYDFDILQKYFPLALGGTLYIGRNVTRGNYFFEYPSYGWISTFGANGKKNWSGSFYGNISVNGYSGTVETVIFYSGVTNFVGLKLRYSEDGGKQFYLGFASEVAISSSVPQPS